MPCPQTIENYLRAFAPELGERILQTFPALHNPGDPVSPRMKTLLRKPYPAQELAAMGVVKHWQEARADSGDRRVWNRQNARGPRGYPLSLSREALHSAGDGARASGGQDSP